MELDPDAPTIGPARPLAGQVTRYCGTTQVRLRDFPSEPVPVVRGSLDSPADPLTP